VDKTNIPKYNILLSNLANTTLLEAFSPIY